MFLLEILFFGLDQNQLCPFKANLFRSDLKPHLIEVCTGLITTGNETVTMTIT